MAACAAAFVAGCAAPAVTPQRVAELAYQALGPEMQLGEQLQLMWVPAPAEAAAGEQGQLITQLSQALARGAREPVHLGVGGPDSVFTAQILRQALRVAPPALPQLRLVFVGRRAEAAELAAALAARGAQLHFEPVAE